VAVAKRRVMTPLSASRFVVSMVALLVTAVSCAAESLAALRRSFERGDLSFMAAFEDAESARRWLDSLEVHSVSDEAAVVYGKACIERLGAVVSSFERGDMKFLSSFNSRGDARRWLDLLKRTEGLSAYRVPAYYGCALLSDDPAGDVRVMLALARELPQMEFIPAALYQIYARTASQEALSLLVNQRFDGASGEMAWYVRSRLFLWFPEELAALLAEEHGGVEGVSAWLDQDPDFLRDLREELGGKPALVQEVVDESGDPIVDEIASRILASTSVPAVKTSADAASSPDNANSEGSGCPVVPLSIAALVSGIAVGWFACYRLYARTRLQSSGNHGSAGSRRSSRR
jgi:hypothetical protein